MPTTWQEIEKPQFPKLESDIDVDVGIIGGGLTGVISAYLLGRSGKKVAVLEDRNLGAVATIDTTAFVTGVVDTSVDNLIKMFGEARACQVWESGFQAIYLA